MTDPVLHALTAGHAGDSLSAILREPGGQLTKRKCRKERTVRCLIAGRRALDWAWHFSHRKPQTFSGLRAPKNWWASAASLLTDMLIPRSHTIDPRFCSRVLMIPALLLFLEQSLTITLGSAPSLVAPLDQGRKSTRAGGIYYPVPRVCLELFVRFQVSNSRES